MIYSRNKSYAKILKEEKLETQAVRQERLNLEFATKAAKHRKFGSWFKQTNSENSMEKAYYG